MLVRVGVRALQVGQTLHPIGKGTATSMAVFQKVSDKSEESSKAEYTSRSGW